MQHKLSPEVGAFDPRGLKRNPKTVVKSLQIRNKRSPDISNIKFYKKIPLFVYGVEKKACSESGLLEGAEYLGNAHTISNKFEMKKNYYFPIAFVKQTEGNKIRGEAYLVSPEHILTLDAVNVNGTTFERVKQRIILEEQDGWEDAKLFGTFPYITAFLYIGNDKHWKSTHLTHVTPKRFPYNNRINHIEFYEWSDEKDDEGEYDEWMYSAYGRNFATVH